MEEIEILSDILDAEKLDLVVENLEVIREILVSWSTAVCSLQYYALIIVPGILMFGLLWWVLRQFLYTR